MVVWRARAMQQETDVSSVSPASRGPERVDPRPKGIPTLQRGRRHCLACGGLCQAEQLNGTSCGNTSSAPVKVKKEAMAGVG